MPSSFLIPTLHLGTRFREAALPNGGSAQEEDSRGGSVGKVRPRRGGSDRAAGTHVHDRPERVVCTVVVVRSVAASAVADDQVLRRVQIDPVNAIGGALLPSTRLPVPFTEMPVEFPSQVFPEMWQFGPATMPNVALARVVQLRTVLPAPTPMPTDMPLLPTVQSAIVHPASATMPPFELVLTLHRGTELFACTLRRVPTFRASESHAGV